MAHRSLSWRLQPMIADSRAFEPLARFGDGFDESLASAMVGSQPRSFDCGRGPSGRALPGCPRQFFFDGGLAGRQSLAPTLPIRACELARSCDVGVARGNHFPHTPLNEGILRSSRRSNRTTWFANRLHRSSAVVPRVPLPRSCDDWCSVIECHPWSVSVENAERFACRFVARDGSPCKESP